MHGMVENEGAKVFLRLQRESRAIAVPRSIIGSGWSGTSASRSDCGPLSTRRRLGRPVATGQAG